MVAQFRKANLGNSCFWRTASNVIGRHNPNSKSTCKHGPTYARSESLTQVRWGHNKVHKWPALVAKEGNKGTQGESRNPHNWAGCPS